jgi:uncharacterized membrane protein YdjX (TVP38/TMEM64 family)
MSALRIAILVTLVLGLIVAAELTGVRSKLTLDGLRALTAGPSGMLLFTVSFVAAQLAHLPGMAFVAAAVVSWGPLVGGLVGWAAAVTAVCTSFTVIRAVGGRAPAKVSRPRIERLLQAVERRPIRTVIVLRMIMWLAPTLTTALALSRVRFRDFAIGSAAGLLPPILMVSLFLDRVLAYLTR